MAEISLGRLNRCIITKQRSIKKANIEVNKKTKNDPKKTVPRIGKKLKTQIAVWTTSAWQDAITSSSRVCLLMSKVSGSKVGMKAFHFFTLKNL